MSRAALTSNLPFGFWLVIGCAVVFLATMAVVVALIASGVVRS